MPRLRHARPKWALISPLLKLATGLVGARVDQPVTLRRLKAAARAERYGPHLCGARRVRLAESALELKLSARVCERRHG